MSYSVRCCPRTGLVCREDCKTPECLPVGESVGEKARRITYQDDPFKILREKPFEVKQMNPHPIIASLRWMADMLERGEVTWFNGGLYISKTDGGYTIQGELELADVEPESERLYPADGNSIG
ncbi:hypothetical protein [Pseudomonas phage ZQG1]|nr:hypothetical protein [Pseudomonas phage ZQG1]